jgi:hypothetical protein
MQSWVETTASLTAPTAVRNALLCRVTSEHLRRHAAETATTQHQEVSPTEKNILHLLRVASSSSPKTQPSATTTASAAAAAWSAASGLEEADGESKSATLTRMRHLVNSITPCKAIRTEHGRWEQTQLQRRRVLGDNLLLAMAGASMVLNPDVAASAGSSLSKTELIMQTQQPPASGEAARAEVTALLEANDPSPLMHAADMACVVPHWRLTEARVLAAQVTAASATEVALEHRHRQLRRLVAEFAWARPSLKR